MKMKEIMKVLLEYKDVFDKLREHDVKTFRKTVKKKRKRNPKKK